MANVLYQEVVIGTNLYPGATHHWVWNNAPAQRVWSASLDVWRAKYFLSGNPRMEVTRIEYVSLFEDFKTQPSEMEIHFYVKNTGTVGANYRLNMAVVSK